MRDHGKILDGSTHTARGIKRKKQRIPLNGWIHEEAEAYRALKSEWTQDNILRLGKVYFKLCRWKQLDMLASTALQEKLVCSTSKAFRRQMREWREEAIAKCSVVSLLDAQEAIPLDLKTFFRSRDIDKDMVPVADPNFINLNTIQYAAFNGDIRLLEEAVSLGAAIDYPVREPTEADPEGETAWPGSTALLLACSVLAMMATSAKYSRRLREGDAKLEERLETVLECAIQLVRLGADCTTKLQIDDSEGPFASRLVEFCGGNKFDAYDLAILSGHEELIRVMEVFESEESRIELVHCRCGSRLPWKQCHGAMDSEPHYHRIRGHLCWRYSPLAYCNCGRTRQNESKNHIDYCWVARPTYKDDSNGRLYRPAGLAMDDHDEGGWFLVAWLALMNGKYQMHPSLSRKKVMTRLVRMPMWMAIERADPDGISVMHQWEMEVYVGIMNRIDDWFPWNDLHWSVSREELLRRTKEWNNALVQYCDDKNLTGCDREETMRLYTANPLAPCANPMCNKRETEVKSFGKCPRCKRTAYCSKECYKGHLKTTHRMHCSKHADV